MRRPGSLLLVAIAVYLFIILITLPAIHLRDLIEERIPGLSLAAISGSVFQGRAGRVEYNGLTVGEVRWKFKPLCLLTGRVEYLFDLAMPEGPGKARAGVTFAGMPYGRDIDLQLLPQRIINHIVPLGVSTNGEINLLIETVKIEEDFPVELTGVAVWKGAAILAPLNLVLGDIDMDLTSNGDEIIGSLVSEGEHGLSGEMAIAPGGVYRVDLLFPRDAEISGDLGMLLENMATIGPDGQYRLRTSGQW